MNNTTPALTISPIPQTVDEHLAEDIMLGRENTKQTRTYRAIVSRTLTHTVIGSQAVAEWGAWTVWKKLKRPEELGGASRRELVEDAIASIAAPIFDARGDFADCLADADWSGAKPIYIEARGVTKEFAVAEITQDMELL